jgi:hypothetical protein
MCIYYGGYYRKDTNQTDHTMTAQCHVSVVNTKLRKILTEGNVTPAFDYLTQNHENEP